MRRAEGWSLVELTMVIVILGILGAFVGPLLLNAMRAYDTTQASVATYAKMRYAMERMAREIRDVRRNATDSGLLDISAMTAATLSFFKTDGTEVVLAGGGGVVSLRYVGTTIGTLTDQVGAFALAYFEQDASPVDAVALPAMASSLAVVEISLTLVEGANNYASRLRVDLRNPQ